MEIRYPEYYKKFHCLAGECPDTCCAGWEIPVDEASEEGYRRSAGKMGEFGRKLKKYIGKGRILCSGEYCPFLDKEGLCEIYKEMGERALCRTCRNHPRHMEDYGNLHEVILLLSCPEVCRLVLKENGGGYFVKKRPERTGNMDGIDEKLLSALLAVRETAWKTGKERELPFDMRMLMALALGHDVQRRIQSGCLDEIYGVLKRYAAEGAYRRFEKQAGLKFAEEQKKAPKRPAAVSCPAADAGYFAAQEGTERFLLMGDFMEAFSGLDAVGNIWPGLLENSRKLLYHSPDSRSRYQDDRKAFLKANPGIEQQWERLFGYFLYSFLLAALYDEDIDTKMKMAVFCTFMIEELDMAAWREHRETALSLREQIKICHAAARQIENSDENRASLERLLWRKDFGLKRVAGAVTDETEFLKSNRRPAE